MIIGPNGTGKSTLVCAICLGLGWGPQHLGRAKELGEFVKHGAREAEIEIELSKGPKHQRNPIIRRVIRREGNKTNFLLNGQQTTHKQIVALCKSFSIQIDNLCQFLPQDRVVEFAALNPVQLLEQTQRAAAPDYMNEWHEQLKEMRKEQKTKTDSRNREHDTLRELQNRHNLQRADVERMHERQSLTKKLEAYSRLRPFVHYRSAKERFNDAKRAAKDAQHELRQLQQREQPTIDALEEKREYHSQVEQAATKRGKLLQRMERNAAAIHQEMNEMQTQINDKENERTAEKNTNKERVRQRDKLKREISVIGERMKERPPDFDAAAYNERAREKQRTARELQIENQDHLQKQREIMQRIRTLEGQKQQTEAEIENLKSQAGQQSNKLKQLSPDTWRAWDWIQKNRDQFTGEVFGPPVVSCSVNDNRFADSVESTFQKGDLLSFTVTNRRDFSILSSKLRNMNLKDIHIKESSRPRDSWRPMMSNEELRQYGFNGWLIDCLSGPDPVLSALCDSLRLHQCAVTLREHNDEQFERIKVSNIQRWVAGRSSYQVSRRREYGDQAVSTIVRPVKPARIWTDQPVNMGAEREHQAKIRDLNHDLEELNNSGHELSAQIQGNKEKIQQLTREKEEIDNKKHDLQKLRGEFEGLQTRKDTCEFRLKELEAELDDMAERLEEIDVAADKLTLDKGQLAINYANSVRRLLDLHQEAYEAEIVLAEAKSELQVFEERSQAIQREIADHQEGIRRLNVERDRLRGEAQRLVDEVNRINDERSEEEEELVVDIQATISIEDLEAEIERFRARLTLLHDGDPNAIRDYERRAKRIEELERKLGGMDTELGELQESIDEIKSQWEPELDALIQKISDAFSFNFSKIGCAGQVSIYKAEDFAEWAIQIQVKFR